MTFTIHRFPSLASTSAYARTHFGTTVHDKSVIVADTQTAGYGRRGTSWVSDEGNLFATLVHTLTPPHPPLQALSCVVGVAVAQALLDSQPDLPLALKWPNDILLGSKKVCGILIESDVLPDGSLALFIGMGMNVGTAPTYFPWIATAPTGPRNDDPQRHCEHSEAIQKSTITQAAALNDFLISPLTPEDVLYRFLSLWEECFSLWLRQGFAPFRAFWTSRAYRLKDAISFEDKPGNSVSGRVVGIDDQGGIVLQFQNNETKSFYSGRFMPT